MIGRDTTYDRGITIAEVSTAKRSLENFTRPTAKLFNTTQADENKRAKSTALLARGMRKLYEWLRLPFALARSH